jgi:hypothetical protein
MTYCGATHSPDPHGWAARFLLGKYNFKLVEMSEPMASDFPFQ